MASDLMLEVSDAPLGAIEVGVRGEVDIVTSPRLLDAILCAAMTGPPQVVVDMGATAFCDGRGLSALVEARNRLEHDGVEMALVASPWIYRLVELAGLTERLHPRLVATASG